MSYVSTCRRCLRSAVLIGALAVCTPSAHGGDLSWFALPALSYSPETGIAGGGAVGFYKRLSAAAHPSSVQALLLATQKRQYMLKLKPEMWLRANQWRLYSELYLLKYPDRYFGIGNRDETEEDYTARRVWLWFTGQRSVAEHVRAGPQVNVDYCRFTDVEPDGLISTGEAPGAEGRTVLGIGASAARDTRDEIFWPTRGTLLQLSALFYSAATSSEYRFVRTTMDARWYRGWGDRHVLAAQAWVDAVAGEAPFLLLPQLGGDDLLRGYREGRYRDKLAVVFQTEYRVKLFWRLSAVAYAGVGAVAADAGDIAVDHIRPAGGIGGRFRVSDEGVNVRADVAFGRGDRGLYITATETF